MRRTAALTKPEHLQSMSLTSNTLPQPFSFPVIREGAGTTCCLRLKCHTWSFLPSTSCCFQLVKHPLSSVRFGALSCNSCFWTTRSGLQILVWLKWAFGFLTPSSCRFSSEQLERFSSPSPLNTPAVFLECEDEEICCLLVCRPETE